MSEDEGEEWAEEEEDSCDYGLCEICEDDPEAKAMGLCTTECHIYLKSLEDEHK